MKSTRAPSRFHLAFVLVFTVCVVWSVVPSRARQTDGVSKDKPAVRVTRHDTPHINLLDGIEVPTVSAQAIELRHRLESNHYRPGALGSADFDEDGVPDLVAGYATYLGGIITLHRGNIGALFPESPQPGQRKVIGELTDSPFLTPARAFELSQAPDFVATGDFDSDGHRDIAVATRGSNQLAFLLGDGKGGLNSPVIVSVPGTVTAMICGEVNRQDGLADLVVGIVGDYGARVLVLESPEGAMRAEAESLSLPAEATGFALGQFDEESGSDLAIAAGNEVIILGGRNRKLSLAGSRGTEVSLSEVYRRRFPFRIRSIAVGDFTGGRQRAEVALLSDDGAIQVLRRSGNARDKNQNQGVAWETERLAIDPWSEATRLVSARVSSAQEATLLVLGANSRQLRIVETGDRQAETAELDADDKILTVLPMRLNQDALDDLVVFVEGKSAPVVVLSAPAAIVTVNSATDVADGDTSSIAALIAAPGADGVVSLREAITAANNTPGADQINFGIGSGPHTITPASQLPTITDPVTIDGYTQPGATANTLLVGSNAVLLIEIDGTNAGNASGLTVNSSNVVVRGLVINRFTGVGANQGTAIFQSPDGGTGVVIEGCFLGTDRTGAIARPNEQQGIRFSSGGNHRVGGNAPAQRNVISGNLLNGVLFANNVDTSHVLGNYIGTNATGTAALGNGTGLAIFTESDNNQIAGNVISGNGVGINIDDNSNNNVMQRNLIGRDAFGVGNIGNSAFGVTIQSSINNTIGGTAAGAGNAIAFNNTGVRITGGTSNAVLGNSIHSNGTAFAHRGIDHIGAQGFNRKDVSDPDSGGGSNLQNLPVLTSARSGGNTTVQGTLNSTASTTFRIEFFSNAGCHASGKGEGRTFLGFQNVTTDGTGNAVIHATLAVAVTAGEVVTATATNPANNTSGFSACQNVMAPAAPTDVSWINASGGNWNNAANWQDGVGVNRVPTTSDDVFITLTGTYTVTLNVSATLNSLTIGTIAGPGTQIFDKSSNTLTLAADSFVLATGVFNHPSGIRTQNGASTLTVSGVYNWAGGQLDGTGATTIAAGRPLNVSGFGGKILRGAHKLNNSGVITSTGTGGIVSGEGSQINNLAGGVFDFQQDSTFGFNGAGAVPTFNNQSGATLRKSVGVGVNIFSNFVLVNNGTLDVQTGSIDFVDNTPAFNDGTIITGAGPVRLNGANVLASGTITVNGTVQLSSGSFDYNTTATWTGTGTLNWSGGQMINTGTTVIAPGFDLVVSGAGGKTLRGGHKLNNSGVIRSTGTGGIISGEGSQINNLAGGVFDLQQDSTYGFNGAGAVPTFNNQSGATLRKSVGVGVNIFSNFVLVNSGTLDVQTGFVDFVNNTPAFNNGTIITGAGLVRLNGANVLASGTITVNGTVQLSSGSFDYNTTATWTGTGTLNWAGGEMRNTGTTVIAPGFHLLVSGGGAKTLRGGHKLNNSGVITSTGTGGITSGEGSQINNLAGGVYDAQQDSTFAFLGLGAIPTFNNQSGATLRKSVGVGVTNFSGFVLVNSGTLDVQTGSVDFGNNPPAFNDGTIITGAGLVRLNGANVLASGTVTVNGTVQLSSGSFDYNTTATWTGTGTLNWAGGEMRNTGTTVIAPGFHLLVSGAGAKTLRGGHKLNNSGVITSTGTGGIISGEASQINNLAGGVFDLQQDSTYGFNGAGAVSTFNNQAGATFRKSVSAGLTTIDDFTFNNAGAVEANSGTLRFVDGYTQTAGSTILNGGALSLGIALQLQGGTLGGAGTITGNVNNTGGTVAPGFSPGCLNITGNYTQGPLGALNIEIGGATVCTQFDRLAITGSATLDGTINAPLIGGFDPPNGTSFQVMTFGSHTGTFSTINGPFTQNFSATDLQLVRTAAISADLQVTKTDSPDPVAAGGNITYTITVTNNGPDAATTNTLNDTVPANTTFQSLVSPGGWSCSTPAVNGTGPITCTNPNIINGAVGAFTLIVNVDAATPDGTVISNTSSVSSSTVDAVPGNNSANASTTVVVTPCTITCPPNQSVNAAPNQCSATVTYPAPTTGGVCGSVTCIPASGSTFNVGITNVTCTASAGPACNFNVTVNDVQSPTITCPPNQNVSAAVPTAVSYPSPTVGDNCSGASSNCAPPSGSTFPLGATTVNCTATDASSNTANCSFSVTLTAPACTITCPPNQTANAALNQCSATVTYPAPTTGGVCGVVTCNPASGSSFNVGTTNVVCTAFAGPSCNFNVTVNDTQAPSITCPLNQNISSPGSIVVSYPAPTVSDNCSGASSNCAPPSGSTFPLGATTVNCTATDGSSNTANCSFSITVTPPAGCAIACPANQTVSTLPNATQCGAAVNYPAPTVAGPCGTVTCSPSSGSFFSIGTTNVTCTTGAGPSCSFTVTVIDNTPPRINCPENIVASAAAGQSTAVVSYVPAVASDNCPGAAVICLPPSGTVFPLGVTGVTCTAQDAANNTTPCTFAVAIQDFEAPAIQCRSNTTVEAPAGQNAAVVTYPLPVVTDNVPGLAVACSPPSGTSFPLGITAVACTATDVAGNRSACGFIVTVNGGLPQVKVTIENNKPAVEFGNGARAKVRRKPKGASDCSFFEVENTGRIPVVLTLESVSRTGSDVESGRISDPDDGALFLMSRVNADGSQTTLVRGDSVRMEILEKARFCVRINPLLPAITGRTNGLPASAVVPAEVASRVSIAVSGGTRFLVNLIGHVATSVTLINAINPRKAAEVTFARSDNLFIVTYSLFDSNQDISRARYEFLNGSGQIVDASVDVEMGEALRGANLVMGQSFTIEQKFTGAKSHPEITGVQVTVTDGDGSARATADLNAITSAETGASSINERSILRLPVLKLRRPSLP